MNASRKHHVKAVEAAAENDEILAAGRVHLGQGYEFVGLATSAKDAAGRAFTVLVAFEFRKQRSTATVSAEVFFEYPEDSYVDVRLVP